LFCVLGVVGHLPAFYWCFCEF